MKPWNLYKLAVALTLVAMLSGAVGGVLPGASARGGPPGTATTDSLSTTRAYTLTGLTNGTWYTVTLNSMAGTTPILTDTVTVMPTDKFVCFPLVLRED
jgi:hypothetical protein